MRSGNLYFFIRGGGKRLSDADFGEFQKECFFAEMVETDEDAGIVTLSGDFKDGAVTESVVGDGKSRRQGISVMLNGGRRLQSFFGSDLMYLSHKVENRGFGESGGCRFPFDRGRGETVVASQIARIDIFNETAGAAIVAASVAEAV